MSPGKGPGWATLGRAPAGEDGFSAACLGQVCCLGPRLPEMRAGPRAFQAPDQDHGHQGPQLCHPVSACESSDLESSHLLPGGVLGQAACTPGVAHNAGGCLRQRSCWAPTFPPPLLTLEAPSLPFPLSPALLPSPFPPPQTSSFLLPSLPPLPPPSPLSSSFPSVSCLPLLFFSFPSVPFPLFSPPSFFPLTFLLSGLLYLRAQKPGPRVETQRLGQGSGDGYLTSPAITGRGLCGHGWGPQAGRAASLLPHPQELRTWSYFTGL